LVDLMPLIKVYPLVLVISNLTQKITLLNITSTTPSLMLFFTGSLNKFSLQKSCCKNID